MTRSESDKLEQMHQEALDWVLLLKTGAATQRDLDACMSWRQISPEHEEAFRDAARLWRQLGIAAQELQKELEDESSEPTPFASAPAGHHPIFNQVMGRRAFLGGALAASAGAYLAVSPPFSLWPSLAELAADYRTGKGEQRRIGLGSDASIEMNTQTSLRVNVTANLFEIDLISGEAVVSAKNMNSKRLVLKAANGVMSAQDARFNVRCLDGEVSVACLQGMLDVEQNHRAVVLETDQAITYSSQGLGAAVLVDPVELTAWQNRTLIFRDRPLYDVIKEVNRYLPGRIVVMNTRLGRKVVNGTFQLDRLDNLIGQIEQLFGARAVSLPGGLTLLS